MDNGALTQFKPHRSKGDDISNMLPKPTPGMVTDTVLRSPPPSPPTNDHSVACGLDTPGDDRPGFFASRRCMITAGRRIHEGRFKSGFRCAVAFHLIELIFKDSDFIDITVSGGFTAL